MLGIHAHFDDLDLDFENVGKACPSFDSREKNHVSLCNDGCVSGCKIILGKKH